MTNLSIWLPEPHGIWVDLISEYVNARKKCQYVHKMPIHSRPIVGHSILYNNSRIKCQYVAVLFSVRQCCAYNVINNVLYYISSHCSLHLYCQLLITLSTPLKMPSSIKNIVDKFPLPTINSIVGTPDYESIADIHLKLNSNSASEFQPRVWHARPFIFYFLASRLRHIIHHYVCSSIQSSTQNFLSDSHCQWLRLGRRSHFDQ